MNRLPQTDLTGFWLFCAFISGFTTISMQIVWSRVLAMIIGSSTYAFSIVLALFLAGLAVGAYLISAGKSQVPSGLWRAILLGGGLTVFTLFLSLRVTSGAPGLRISTGVPVRIDSSSS